MLDEAQIMIHDRTLIGLELPYFQKAKSIHILRKSVENAKFTRKSINRQFSL
jgi:hypothetical protein